MYGTFVELLENVLPNNDNEAIHPCNLSIILEGIESYPVFEPGPNGEMELVEDKYFIEMVCERCPLFSEQDEWFYCSTLLEVLA